MKKCNINNIMNKKGNLMVKSNDKMQNFYNSHYAKKGEDSITISD